MPFVHFNQSYDAFLRQALEHYKDEHSMRDFSLFAQWIQLGRVRTHFLHNTIDRKVLPEEDQKRLREAAGKNNQEAYYVFAPSPQTWQEIIAIRTMVSEVTLKIKKGEALPGNFGAERFARSSYAAMLNRVREWELWKADETIKQEYEVVARLGNQYQLVRTRSISAAVRDGKKLRNCMQQLALPESSRTTYMGDITKALGQGRIWSLWDDQQIAAAAIVVGTDEGIEHIFGECNGGLQHDIAMVLRRHVLEKKIPIRENAATMIGLVSRDKTLRPYEEVLDILFSDEFVDLSGLPITQDELGSVVAGRTIHIKTLNLFKCVNIKHIPETLIIEKGIRILSLDKQQKFWTRDEANMYFKGIEAPEAERPKKRDVRNRELRRELRRVYRNLG